MPVYDMTYEPTPNRLAWTIPASMVVGPTTYPNYATWNNFNNTATPNNASGTINGADYYAGSGTVGNYAASLFVNITPLSTGTGYTAISGNTAPSGNYRLRRVGGGLTGDVPGFIIGTLDIRQPDNAGRRAIRVSPSVTGSDRSQDMIDAFGTGTPNNGGSWVLERETPGTSIVEDEYRLVYNPVNPTGTPNQTPSIDTTRWTALVPTTWNATEGYPTVGSLVTNGGQLFSSLNAISAITAGPMTTYTEIGRWNDQNNYRTAGDADWTNFSGGSWCANRGPLNNAADPFPLNTSNTYRLRYIPGGSATAPAAQIIGTPTQIHIDSSPGGGIACYRFGTSAAMITAFGQPISNPGSPPAFHGGQWVLERQTTVQGATPTADWRATAIATNGTARYNHTGMHLAISTTANSGAFPTNLTGTWELRQAGTNRTVTGPLTIVNPASGGVIDIRVGSASQMNTAFGPTAITSGGNFELIKTMNAAPNIDTANWSQLVVSVWNANSAYSINAVVNVSTNYFRASVNIPAPQPTPARLTWVRRTNIPEAAGVASYAYDTDTSAMIWRPSIPANAALLENGQPLRQENNTILEFD